MRTADKDDKFLFFIFLFLFLFSFYFFPAYLNLLLLVVNRLSLVSMEMCSKFDMLLLEAKILSTSSTCYMRVLILIQLSAFKLYFTCVSSVLSKVQPSVRLVSFTVIVLLPLCILKGFSLVRLDSRNPSLSAISTRL